MGDRDCQPEALAAHLSAARPFTNATKAKPLVVRVALLMGTVTSWTLPNCSKISFSCFWLPWLCTDHEGIYIRDKHRGACLLGQAAAGKRSAGKAHRSEVGHVQHAGEQDVHAAHDGPLGAQQLYEAAAAFWPAGQLEGLGTLLDFLLLLLPSPVALLLVSMATLQDEEAIVSMPLVCI